MTEVLQFCYNDENWAYGTTMSNIGRSLRIFQFLLILGADPILN